MQLLQISLLPSSNLSNSRTKTDIVIAHSCSNYDNEDFPTIASCKAALLKEQANPESLDSIPVSEPALVKLKKERDPDKLFLLFKSNAHNRLVVKNRFVFEDTVLQLAGASRFDLIEQLLEHQKALPQGRHGGFVIRIIMLYERARMPGHACETFEEMHLFGCPRTVKSFNAMLKVLYENGNGRRFDEIREVIDGTRAKFGIVSNDISFNIIIKVLCEMGHLDDASLTMVDMEKSVGLNPMLTILYALQNFQYYDTNGDGFLYSLATLLRVFQSCCPSLSIRCASAT